uniref:hypothetical protein n=1 Tax=Prevotella sp. TaxID=59823 RepID=UPI003FEECC41
MKGEQISDLTEAYIYNVGAEIFIKNNRSASEKDINNANLWTITNENDTYKFACGNKKLFLNYDVVAWFCDISDLTYTYFTLVNATTEDKGYAYKLKNTKKVWSKYQTRYFSVEGTSYVGAENEENINNNWLFISEAQKNAYLDYKAKYNEAKNYASNEKVEANVTLLAKLKKILSDKAKATYASYEGENGDQMVLSNIIEEIKTYLNSTPTGIDNMNANTSAKAEAIFSVNGVRNAQLNKGLNIVKMSDGSVKKIMVK